jgi:acetyl esterase
MSLDPKAKALLTAIIAAGDPEVQLLPAAEARSLVHSCYEQLNLPLKEVESITDRIIPGPGGDLLLRIYTPKGPGPFPVLIFIHGGGWVLFRPRHYDSVCTHLCAGSSCIVVSVDYRLSPETKFPGALDDCMEALRWVSLHAVSFNGDPSRIIISGDSAGGNLAAAVTLRNRDEKGPGVLAQVLIYPVTAWYEPPTGSFKEFAGGYSLTAESLVWFWEQYLTTREQSADPYAVPMNAADLYGLPEALVLVSGYDPLRDEGKLYAEKLHNAGVKTTLLDFDTMIHGFLSYIGILNQAETAIVQICGWLSARFGS